MYFGLRKYSGGLLILPPKEPTREITEKLPDSEEPTTNEVIENKATIV